MKIFLPNLGYSSFHSRVLDYVVEMNYLVL